MSDKSTKLVGDISELMVMTELSKKGYNVLVPYGDRLSYDIVAETSNKFIRLQVKTAYYNKKEDIFNGNTRRARTNRKNYSFTQVDIKGADFFIYVVQEYNCFYILPSNIVSKYKSKCGFTPHRSRKGKGLEQYKNKWNILI